MGGHAKGVGSTFNGGLGVKSSTRIGAVVEGGGGSLENNNKIIRELSRIQRVGKNEGLQSLKEFDRGGAGRTVAGSGVYRARVPGSNLLSLFNDEEDDQEEDAFLDFFVRRSKYQGAGEGVERGSGREDEKLRSQTEDDTLELPRIESRNLQQEASVTKKSNMKDLF